jgi:hypothetical protein
MVIQQLMGDLETLRVKNKVKIGKHLHGGESVIFTPTESEILMILMNNFGVEIAISEICKAVFGWDNTPHTDTFRIHMSRIKKGLTIIDENYNLSSRNGFACLTHVQPFNKILDLKNSLRTLLSNENHLEGKDYELLKLLKEA